MKILDACCGSRLFWFDKNCDFATYMDIREETYEIHSKKVNVKPDIVAFFYDRLPSDESTNKENPEDATPLSSEELLVIKEKYTKKTDRQQAESVKK